MGCSDKKIVKIWHRSRLSQCDFENSINNKDALKSQLINTKTIFCKSYWETGINTFVTKVSMIHSNCLHAWTKKYVNMLSVQALLYVCEVIKAFVKNVLNLVVTMHSPWTNRREERVSPALDFPTWLLSMLDGNCSVSLASSPTDECRPLKSSAKVNSSSFILFLINDHKKDKSN